MTIRNQINRARPPGAPGEATVMLLGPTASGKSAAAMLIAQHHDVEIISVDSAQVYVGMDIGTAKPNAAQRATVRHHLIDIIEPDNSYSAARFAHDAAALISQIRARKRKPLLVGGTLLYAKALMDGLNHLPGADPAVRARLESQAIDIGWPGMHERLAQIDPTTAARLKPADAQRIERALEVYELTGQPLSVLLANPARTNISADGQVNRYLPIALEPGDRAQLHQRIAMRFTQMMRDGLLDEVRHLHLRPELNADLPSMRCVGYRQLYQWLDHGADDAQLDAAVASAVAATRQLAKRQLTWLRNMPGKMSIDCLAADAGEQALAIARGEWARN